MQNIAIKGYKKYVKNPTSVAISTTFATYLEYQSMYLKSCM